MRKILSRHEIKNQIKDFKNLLIAACYTLQKAINVLGKIISTMSTLMVFAVYFFFFLIIVLASSSQILPEVGLTLKIGYNIYSYLYAIVLFSLPGLFKLPLDWHKYAKNMPRRIFYIKILKITAARLAKWEFLYLTFLPYSIFLLILSSENCSAPRELVNTWLNTRDNLYTIYSILLTILVLSITLIYRSLRETRRESKTKIARNVLLTFISLFTHQLSIAIPLSQNAPGFYVFSSIYTEALAHLILLTAISTLLIDNFYKEVNVEKIIEDLEDIVLLILYLVVFLSIGAIFYQLLQNKEGASLIFALLPFLVQVHTLPSALILDSIIKKYEKEFELRTKIIMSKSFQFLSKP